MKCTSPANAKVNWPDALGVGVGVGLAVVGGVSDPGAREDVGAFEDVGALETGVVGAARCALLVQPASSSRTIPIQSRRAADRLVGVACERNVLGGELVPCGTDPVTGFYRDGCCNTGPEDLGSHTVCAVVTAEFLEHQRGVGNDLSTPRPEYAFPGLRPGDRWCVVAARWLQAYHDGVAAPVVLAATHERALDVVPLDALREHAVDVPDDLSSLD